MKITPKSALWAKQAILCFQYTLLCSTELHYMGPINMGPPCENTCTNAGMLL